MELSGGPFGPWWDRDVGCIARQGYFEFCDGDEVRGYVDVPGARG